MSGTCVTGIHISRTAVRIAEFGRGRLLKRLLEVPLSFWREPAQKRRPRLPFLVPRGFAAISTHEAHFKNIGEAHSGAGGSLAERAKQLEGHLRGVEDLVYDFFAIAGYVGQPPQGCLAVARAAAVRRCLEIMESVGVRPGGVDVEILALFRLWRISLPTIGGELVGIAHADGGTVSAGIFDCSVPLVMRQVVCDGPRPSREAVEGFVGALALEVGRGLPARILATGAEQAAAGADLLASISLAPEIAGPESAGLRQRSMVAIAAAAARPMSRRGARSWR